MVASRRDAWIETLKLPGILKGKKVASRRDAWIETNNLRIFKRFIDSRIPQGCVD